MNVHLVNLCAVNRVVGRCVTASGVHKQKGVFLRENPSQSCKRVLNRSVLEWNSQKTATQTCILYVYMHKSIHSIFYHIEYICRLVSQSHLRLCKSPATFIPFWNSLALHCTCYHHTSFSVLHMCLYLSPL